MALAKGEVGLKQMKPVLKFDAAMKEFLTWSEQNHKAHPQSYRRHKIRSVALLKYFKRVALDMITVEDIERFKHKRMSTKSPRTKRLLKPATVNRELATLRLLFNWCIQNEVVTANPVTRIKFLTENNEQTRVISFDEQKAYLAYVPSRSVTWLP